MTPTGLTEILENYPDIPLRLTLSSGDQIVIPNATAAVVEISHVYLFPRLRGRFTEERGKYVSIVNIAMVEPMDVGDGDGRSTN